MCLIKEVWKDIPDYPNYQVSNYGRVKSLERVVIYNDGRTQLRKEQILHQCLDRKGYLRIGLHKNNIHKSFRVHRLVALAFLENPDNLPQVNHINENPDFNFVAIVNNKIVSSSLEYCDNYYNCHYGTKIHRQSEKMKGENNPFYGKHHTKETRKKLCEQRKGKPQYKHRKPILQYTLDGVFVKEWYGVTEVEKELGLSHKNISRHLKGKTKSAYGFIWKYKE